MHVLLTEGGEQNKTSVLQYTIMHLIIVYLEFDCFGYIIAEAYGVMIECTTIIITVTDAR